MNEQYLSSTGFKCQKVDLTMHGSSFNNNHFVQSVTLTTRAKELLKLSHIINVCLIRLNIVLLYS